MQATDDAIVIVQDTSRRFGQTVAIDHMNLSIQPGELFGILGPDGAGKTTLLRMIAAVLDPTDMETGGLRGRVAGLIHPPTGHLVVAGFDTVKQSQQVKARISYMPQAFGLYGDLSVDENLTFVADVFDVSGQERIDRIQEMLNFAGLEQFRERRVGVLSGGMKKKLALACALLHRPQILLLDEPTTGVDPVARRDFWDLLSRLHGQGITAIVTTPYMDEAERCNRVALLFQGRLLAEGTPQAIKAHIPGTVLSLRDVDIRVAQRALQGIEGLLDIQMYGDQLNLIVKGDANQFKAESARRLEQAGLGKPAFEIVPVSMEEAFIYLVEAAKGDCHEPTYYRAIVRKEFFQILRDPGTLILLTLGPVFLLLVFVFMLTSDVRDVPTAVVDLSDNAASRNLIETLDSAPEIKITQHLQDADAANSLFDQGAIRILIVIPPNYGNLLTMVTGSGARLQITVDGTEPQSAERAADRIYTILEDDMRQIVSNSAAGGLLSSLMDTPVQIDITRLFNPDLRGLVGFFPGIAAMVLSLPGIALTLAIVRERELGTLENLVATPVSKAGLLLGKITPYLIFGTLDALLIVAVGRVMFNMPFRGNILAYLFVSFLFMISNMGLGLFISVLVRTQQVAMIVSLLVFLIPGFFLSGVFFPAWAMPLILRLDLLALPVTHYVAISQGMYLQGTTLGDLWLNVVALGLLSIALLSLSMLVFRKKVA